MQLPQISDAWKRILMRAAVGGLLVFLSTLSTGHDYSIPSLLGAGLGGLIAALTNVNGVLTSPSVPGAKETTLESWLKHI